MLQRFLYKSFFIFTLLSLSIIIVFEYIAFAYYWDSAQQMMRANFFSLITKFLRLTLMICWLITVLLMKHPLKSRLGKVLFIYFIIVLVHSIIEKSIINIMSYSSVYILLGFLFLFHMNKSGIVNFKLLKLYTILNIISLFAIIILDTLTNHEVSNQGYMLLSFLPMIYIAFPKKINTFLLMIVLTGILLSLKRGAILAAFISTLFIYYYFFKRNQITRQVILLITFMVIAMVIILMINYLGESFIGRFADFQGEQAGSGRLIFWGLLLDSWFNADWFDKIFGFGILATVSFLESLYMSIFSHTDWLEILYDFGLIGFAVYLVFLSDLFTKWRQISKKSDPYALPMGLCFIIFFLSSIYSGNMIFNTFIYLIMPIAMVYGYLYQLNIEKNNPSFIPENL